MLTAQRPTIVSRSNTTRGDHKIVLLNHTTGSLDAKLVRQQSVVNKRYDTGDIIHFRFVVGDDFYSFSGSHASIYAIHNLGECALQVNALLETEGSEVLGILVQHLSVENLVAIWITQPSEWLGSQLGRTQ